MNKYLVILAAIGFMGYPVAIQADTTTSAAQASLSTTPIVAQALLKPVWVTAYTSIPDETSDHPLITASGDMVRDGIVAANFLPFGTKIQIPALFGDKVFVVEDRTSQKFSGRVDIWMPTLTKAVDFGIQNAQIVVLDSPASTSTQANPTGLALQ